MSSPHLPEDLAAWPEDPYALLAVTPGVLPTDLRRAYTRLIRTYKPEQFPEHFRRIREAYEAILRHAEEGEFLGMGSLEASAEGQGSSESAPPASGLEAELHAIWEQAIGGDQAAAYERLREISTRHPGRLDVYLRLYWLLAVCPEVDSGREPFAWLTQGVGLAGWSIPLGELIRREVQADPARGLTPAYTEMVDRFPQAEVLMPLCQWRWQAAARLGQWQVIDGDLRGLRSRLHGEDEETWARLLHLGVNLLTWAADGPAADALAGHFHELEGMDHLHARLGQELDQVEFLREMSTGWRALRRAHGVPPEVVALVPVCWTNPPEEYRPRLWAFLDGVARDPHAWLGRLDLVHQEGGPVLTFLGGVVGRQPEEDEAAPDPRTGDVFGQTLTEFVLRLGRGKYKKLRGPILDFCLREAIAPEMVAEFVRDSPADRLAGPDSLAARLIGDLPLRFVCLAHRVFWVPAA